MKPQQVEIAFDNKAIVAFNAGVLNWEIEWSNIERIGYRTTGNGPWQDDYFLVVRTKDKPARFYDISLDWKGAKELSTFIDRLPDTKLPPEGKLANSTKNISVTVWPSAKSGQSVEGNS